jgi:hypothetical protein
MFLLLIFQTVRWLEKIFIVAFLACMFCHDWFGDKVLDERKINPIT